NEYRHKVSECTNISVGYKGQHTRLESQNVFFAYQLLNALIKADWSKLVFVRKPSKYDDYDDKNSGWWDNYRPGDYAKRYG
ncbi:hypothetical protein, partial [Streptococcus pneumoniae]|uniref:hypothetical protein n=1 Tax=Streptococcus pneumoniae TaxID=1313 RepID=UPI001E5B0392